MSVKSMTLRVNPRVQFSDVDNSCLQNLLLWHHFTSSSVLHKSTARN